MAWERRRAPSSSLGQACRKMANGTPRLRSAYYGAFGTCSAFSSCSNRQLPCMRQLLRVSLPKTPCCPHRRTCRFRNPLRSRDFDLKGGILATAQNYGDLKRQKRQKNRHHCMVAAREKDRYSDSPRFGHSITHFARVCKCCSCT